MGKINKTTNYIVARPEYDENSPRGTTVKRPPASPQAKQRRSPAAKLEIAAVSGLGSVGMYRLLGFGWKKGCPGSQGSMSALGKSWSLEDFNSTNQQGFWDICSSVGVDYW